MLKSIPSLNDLYRLIDKVPRYPITARQLVELAASNNSTTSVVDFYNSFPNNLTFENKEDLATLSEQIEIMNSEFDQPKEILTSSEDD